jgi:outer membrane protein TolC
LAESRTGSALPREENLRVARDRYQHQVGTNTEVLDAETLRLQAYTNFYNSTYEALLADLPLRQAIGSLSRTASPLRGSE